MEEVAVHHIPAKPAEPEYWTVIQFYVIHGYPYHDERRFIVEADAVAFAALANKGTVS